MKSWIHEDILKSWTDAQKRLWESLCSSVPLRPPKGVEAWREAYLKNLASWEAAVQHSLAQEAAWVEEWVRRVAQEKGTPELMAPWVRQMEEVLQRWIQTQTQWWNDYFALLRRGGFVQPESADAPLTALTSPAASAAPVAVAEPPPVAASAPLSVAVTAPPDDLKLIKGIGPALEKKLHACGITRFREVAALSDAEIARIEAVIKFAGRIRREDWIGQAQALLARP